MTQNGKLSECFLGFSRTKTEKSRTWQFDGKYFNYFLTLEIIKYTFFILLLRLPIPLFCKRFQQKIFVFKYFLVYSLGPLVGKVKDYQVEVIVDTLCNNMVMIGLRPFEIFFNFDIFFYFFHKENVTSWIVLLASRLHIF